MPWGTWAPVIGSVIGGAADAWSTNAANKANAANVKAQIDFQREQGNTSYQRGVADMQAAGLNPALAYQNGGASTSSGAAATNRPLTENSTSRFATALNTWQAVANGAAQRDLLREQASAAGANASLTMQQVQMNQPQAILSQDPEYAKEYRNTEFAKRLREQFESTNYPARFRADIANLGAGTAQAQAAAAESRARTTLNEQQFQNEWFRKTVSPYINSTAKLTDLFGRVNNLTHYR